MTLKVHVAMSSSGYPAPCVGWTHQRKELVANFKAQFGKTPQEHGYRVVRATLTIEEMTR